MKIQYTYANTDSLIEKKLEELEDYKKVAVDIETSGAEKKDALDPRKGDIRLIQICNSEHQVLVIDWFKISDTHKMKVKKFLEDKNRLKIFHNAKFDIKFLAMEGIFITNVLDTMILASVLEAGAQKKFALAEVVLRHLGISLNKDEQVSDWGADTLSKDQIKYSAIDAAILIPLSDVLVSEIKTNSLQDTFDIEMKALYGVIEMELNGIEVDVEKINLLKQQLLKEQKELSEKIKALFGDINPNSHKQLREALKNKGIAVENTTKETLSRLASKHEEIRVILANKNTSKQLEFAKKIPESIDTITGRLHSNYYQLGTATGRLSCTNFNLQQVPNAKVFRACFIPKEDNVFVIADYSQMQIRIAAEFSGDETMKKIYQNGADLHIITASALSGKSLKEVTTEERNLAKALNFGMMFGMGADSLVEYAWKSYGVELTSKEASIFISKFYEKYKGFKSWQNSVTRENSYQSRTILGRRRLFPKGGNYTQLINTPIQGVEGDILKVALGLLVDRLEKTSGKLIATVHDEVIVECKETEAAIVAKIVEEAMEEAGQRFLKEIPVVVDVCIGKSWADK